MMNVAKIYSVLGNPNSLIPLGVKDVSSCLGMTAGSYVTGKEEGFDRFIDEFGTEALWLGGIPFYKWIFNKTVFKAFGLDSKIDPRNLKDMKLYEKMKEFAPSEDIKKSLEKAGKNRKLFKNIAATRFVASTLMAIGSYVGLTKLKHHYTEQKIRKNLIKEHEAKKEKIANNNPSFKGIGRIMEEFAFSPVKNMYIVDGFITTERLADSRSSQELAGYAIKEGSILLFLYYAGKQIQKHMENAAKKNHNKSITLDSRVLEDEKLKKSFETSDIEKSIREFKAASVTDESLYEFLQKNPENKIIQFAKQSDVLTTYKTKSKIGFKESLKRLSHGQSLYDNTNKIDSRAFNDLEELKGISSQIEELYGQYKAAIKNNESSDKFFEKVRKLKRGSIRMNIGACIMALGVITPTIMLIKRMTDKSGPEFQTKKEIKEQLIRDGVITE